MNIVTLESHPRYKWHKNPVDRAEEMVATINAVYKECLAAGKSFPELEKGLVPLRTVANRLGIELFDARMLAEELENQSLIRIEYISLDVMNGQQLTNIIFLSAAN